eukprot:TRINITY_DN8956_c0_g1_i3.p1 TRINITY_DN8956_c0_g1~~TRINITY_DN8956_c0_g1_i3.p1  ORF type:complete len:469 (-),score=53.33 TRINITY_DN8956_c0_g1_i3:617-1828(-)
MGKMQANRFSENQENMQNQESPKLPMWQSNQMDESVQCTPVTTGKRPVKGVHQDDDSDEDSPPQKPLKKLRTDWEMVTQTQTNDVNYNKLQDADMECLNIFQLDYAELRIRWNQLPDQLAKFRLERVMEVQFKQIRRIVEGRSCIVEEVIGRLDGVRYAVKHYKPDTTYMRQFVREVQALALVADHPNITTYYQAWIEKDVLKKGYRGYIQLKLCKESLTQFLKNNGGKLSEAQATQLMKQIGSALEHCHSNGIAHVDVKPDNIFVLESGKQEGSGMVFMLGDFGQAAPINSTDLAIEQGDSRYLAQEVMNRDRSKMELGDMYSLGVTLYQCVAGINPKDKATFQKLCAGQNPAQLSPKNLFHKKILALCGDRDHRMTATNLLQDRASLPFKKKTSSNFISRK